MKPIVMQTLIARISSEYSSAEFATVVDEAEKELSKDEFLELLDLVRLVKGQEDTLDVKMGHRKE